MNKQILLLSRSILLLLCILTKGMAGRPLNILFVVGHFPAPSQIFILNQMTGLIDRGHNIHIFSFNYDSYDHLHPNIAKYGLLDKLIYSLSPEELPDCDIVLCQFGYIGKKIVELPRLQRWLRRKKIVTCFRGADASSKVKKRPRMYRNLFKRGDLFLPVCNFLKSKILEIGCPERRTKVHYSAIDCSQFTFKKREFPEDGAVKFISVSRLVEKKGIIFAIRAIAKMAKIFPNIEFLIVGEGPERENLEKEIKLLNVEKHVTLCGWKSQKEVAELLKKAHVFILASVKGSDGNREGIPNALKEAMAEGLPVIATIHGGNTELIEDGVSGFLVREKSSIELAQKIFYVMSHPEEWEAIGRSARTIIEDRFEIKKNMIQLEALFNNLLKRNLDYL